MFAGSAGESANSSLATGRVRRLNVVPASDADSAVHRMSAVRVGEAAKPPARCRRSDGEFIK